MLYHPFNVYLDSKRVSILIEAVLPTLPMLYLPFNVYLDSKRVSILIEAVLPTLPMLYPPFNVYLDSKRVSILIEAVLPTLPMLYHPFNVYLYSKRVSILIEAKQNRQRQNVKNYLYFLSFVFKGKMITTCTKYKFWKSQKTIEEREINLLAFFKSIQDAYILSILLFYWNCFVLLVKFCSLIILHYKLNYSLNCSLYM